MQAKADPIRHGMTGEEVLTILEREPAIEVDWIDPITVNSPRRAGAASGTASRAASAWTSAAMGAG
ncbi:MAG TPA: hypothetical protein VEL76_18290 [Gemmataceae bacterium]|nr:hypothetical protein [Gemmataceae bacterium]